MSFIRLPYPHQGQRLVRNEAKRFNWLSAGRRWRKTTLTMAIAVESAAQGKTIIWGAPTYDQVRIGFDETQKAAVGVADFNQSRMEASFPNNGKIMYRSLDKADNVRGHTADGVVMDEAAFIDKKAWNQVLRPMLIDTGGWSWAIGTPNGRNWYWEEHVKAVDDPNSMAWQVPTLGVRITDKGLVREPHPYENPDIPFDEIEKLFQSMPTKIFEQEILGQFVDLSGGVFRRVQEAAVLQPSEPQAGRQYVAGVDVASSVDFTVVSVLDAESKEMVYLDRFNRVDYPVLIDRLDSVYKRYNLTAMVVESNSIGRPVIDELVARGLNIVPFTTTSATKQAIIQGLQNAFENGLIRVLDEPVLVGELLSFESKRNASGSFSYSAPPGMHDDCVMSLAIAWNAVSDRGIILWMD
ncbi:MAG: terminase family protein [bacterium]|jgi:phage terminase large subunit-like protein|nr:terminase family protein [bacterium]